MLLYPRARSPRGKGELDEEAIASGRPSDRFLSCRAGSSAGVGDTAAVVTRLCLLHHVFRGRMLVQLWCRQVPKRQSCGSRKSPLGSRSAAHESIKSPHVSINPFFGSRESFSTPIWRLAVRFASFTGRFWRFRARVSVSPGVFDAFSSIFQFLQAEVEFFGLWGEFFAAFGALAGCPGDEGWGGRRLGLYSARLYCWRNFQASRFTISATAA